MKNLIIALVALGSPSLGQGAFAAPSPIPAIRHDDSLCYRRYRRRRYPIIIRRTYRPLYGRRLRRRPLIIRRTYRPLYGRRFRHYRYR